METAVKRPKVTIEAVITRADGTVENLGIIVGQENIKKLEEVKDNG